MHWGCNIYWKRLRELLWVLRLRLKNTMITVPHAKLSVRYCIKIWWMLYTLPRSTRHSAVDLVFPEIVHCPPPAERSVYRPSTALSDPQGLPGKLDSCHVCLLRARFSVIWFKFSRIIFYSIVSQNCEVIKNALRVRFIIAWRYL